MSAAATPLVRSRFFWKLYASYLLVVLVTAAIAAWTVGRAIERSALADVDASLEARGRLFATLALAEDGLEPSADLQARVAELGRRTETRLTLIGADGTVLADSEEDPARMENHRSRPEVQDALEKGSGDALRFSGSTGHDTRYHAVRLERDGRPIGFARVALDVSIVDRRLADARASVALASAIAALLGLALAIPIARRVTRPIRAMTDAADALVRGDVHHELAPIGTDEIAELSSSFQSMSRELSSRLAALSADRNKVVAILSSMVEGVVAVDRDERVVHINAAAARLLRADAHAAPGKRVWESTRVIEVSQILDEARTQGDVRHGEVRIGDNGVERIVELFASPLVGGSGESAGAVVVLHDVTELRRLEAVRRDFVANVSHELKTPLTAIRGLVETLLDDDRMPEPTRRRFLDKIRDQTSRLTTIVLDLLTLARIESETDAPERRRIDVRSALRECADRIAPLCERKALAFALELPDRPLEIFGDEESLRQIVGNLLDNAVKYTAAHGRVRLSASSAGELLSIEVIDTGIGIEPRDQERIFERFYRVDKARSRELGGTGLGLSIVKHLTLALGGRVSVDSTPGRGSTFRVVLPLCADTA